MHPSTTKYDIELEFPNLRYSISSDVTNLRIFTLFVMQEVVLEAEHAVSDSNPIAQDHVRPTHAENYVV